MFFDHIITMEPYRATHAVEPWNSIDAEHVRRIPAVLVPPGQAAAPVKEEPKKVVPKLPKKKDEPQPPKGYDREKLDRAMVHAYNDQELADALGLSLYMMRKWLKWRYR